MSFRVTSSTPSYSVSRPSQLAISASGSACSFRLLRNRLRFDGFRESSVGSDQVVPEVAVVAALGHRRQAPADGGPRLALVLAEEDVAVGGAGDQFEATRERIHRHALDVASKMPRQASSQVVPGAAAVAGPGDSRVGVFGVAPAARAVARASGEHN